MALIPVESVDEIPDGEYRVSPDPTRVSTTLLARPDGTTYVVPNSVFSDVRHVATEIRIRKAI